MTKFFILLIALSFQISAFAESECDVRPGNSIGIKVVEFATGNTIHSKMPMSESTGQTLLEEMINLQEMGVCKEKIISQKCILRFEKKAKNNFITLYRGAHLWTTWTLRSKVKAQSFVKNLKRAGFCS